MLGGYQILDLRNIDLSRSTSETSITDVEVLKQLSQIADHIQKSYDFSKPLHNQLKPLLIRYRDKKVGEKHEVACYGNIEVINTYYKFRIIAKNEDEQLTINVEFEEKTDEYSNKYWDIKTATILLTTNVDIKGDLTANSIVENMSGYELIIENATKWEPIYCGAVKTGNKITFVVFGSFTKTSNDPFTLCEFNIPSEVGDKLYPYLVGSENNFLDNKKISFINVANPRIAEDGIIDTQKITNKQIQMSIRNIDSLTANQEFYFRYEVTFLLSDNLISNE